MSSSGQAASLPIQSNTLLAMSVLQAAGQSGASAGATTTMLPPAAPPTTALQKFLAAENPSVAQSLVSMSQPGPSAPSTFPSLLPGIRAIIADRQHVLPIAGGVVVEAISRKVTAASIYRAILGLGVPASFLALPKPARQPNGLPVLPSISAVDDVDSTVREALKPEAGLFLFLDEHEQARGEVITSDPSLPLKERVDAALLASAMPIHTTAGVRMPIAEAKKMSGAAVPPSSSSSSSSSFLAGCTNPSPLPNLQSFVPYAEKASQTNAGGGGLMVAGALSLNKGSLYLPRFPSNHQLYFIPSYDGVPIPVGRMKQPPLCYFSPPPSAAAAATATAMGAFWHADQVASFPGYPSAVTQTAREKELNLAKQLSEGTNFHLLRAWFARHWAQQALLAATSSHSSHHYGGGQATGVMDVETRDYLTRATGLQAPAIFAWLKAERRLWHDQLIATCWFEATPIRPAPHVSVPSSSSLLSLSSPSTPSERIASVILGGPAITAAAAAASASAASAATPSSVSALLASSAAEVLSATTAVIGSKGEGGDDDDEGGGGEGQPPSAKRPRTEESSSGSSRVVSAVAGASFTAADHRKAASALSAALPVNVSPLSRAVAKAVASASPLLDPAAVALAAYAHSPSYGLIAFAAHSSSAAPSISSFGRRYRLRQEQARAKSASASSSSSSSSSSSALSAAALAKPGQRKGRGSSLPAVSSFFSRLSVHQQGQARFLLPVAPPATATGLATSTTNNNAYVLSASVVGFVLPPAVDHVLSVPRAAPLTPAAAYGSGKIVPSSDGKGLCYQATPTAVASSSEEEGSQQLRGLAACLGIPVNELAELWKEAAKKDAEASSSSSSSSGGGDNSKGNMATNKKKDSTMSLYTFAMPSSSSSSSSSSASAIPFDPRSLVEIKLTAPSASPSH